MRPIHLALCAACDTGDTGRPAAGLLVQWFADGGGKDASHVREGAHLPAEWIREFRNRPDMARRVDCEVCVAGRIPPAVPILGVGEPGRGAFHGPAEAARPLRGRLPCGRCGG
ncbi:DUF6300 family protein [Streptomyces sp. NPDC001919]